MIKLAFILLLLVPSICRATDWRTLAADAKANGVPYGAWIGDSTASSYSNSFSFLSPIGRQGNMLGDPGHLMSLRTAFAMIITNIAVEGATTLTARNIQWPALLALGTSNALFRVGVNDIGAGYTWEQSKTNWDFMAKSAASNNITMRVHEILLSSSLNAVKAAWNDSLKEWCSTNQSGAVTVFVRSATNLANLAGTAMEPINTWDGVHKTAYGTSNDVWNSALEIDAYYGSATPLYTAPTCPLILDYSTNSGGAGGGYRLVGDTAANQYVSSLFTASNSVNNCTFNDLVISRFGNPPGSLTVEIRGSTAGGYPTNTIATSGPIPNTVYTNQYALTPQPYRIRFQFSTFSITNTSNYHFVVKTDVVGDASNYYGVWNCAETSGKIMSWSSDGVQWTPKFTAAILYWLGSSPCGTNRMTISGKAAISGKVTTQ